MHIAGPTRPPSDLEQLEIRRDRLAELVSEGLVSSSLSLQLARAVADLDRQIVAERSARSGFAIAA